MCSSVFINVCYYVFLFTFLTYEASDHSLARARQEHCEKTLTLGTTERRFGPILTHMAEQSFTTIKRRQGCHPTEL